MSRSAALPVACLCAVLIVGCQPSPSTQHAASDSTAANATSRTIAAGPPPGTKLTEAYVQTVGRMAYIMGWPLVNSFNRRTAMSAAPEPGLNGGVLPVAPPSRLSMLSDYIQPDQSFVACTNQDVVYGAGYCELDTSPVVIQVPDFGDRFWVYALYDARTDQFGNLGKAYGTKPGFYLVVGPNWTEQPPAGIAGVLRSPTELAFVAPRVFREESPADLEAVRALINQIDMYPLAEFDGKMKSRDWTKSPHFPAPTATGGGEMKWVNPETFFDQLPVVMKVIPPQAGEEALYHQIESVLAAAEKDPAVKATLKETAIAAEKDMIQPLFQWEMNGRPAGNGWNSPVNNAQWGTDYVNRAAIAKSNIYENRPTETKYLFTDNDGTGQPLNGANSYSITFANGQTPPVKGFWSVTLYNEHHFFNPNPLNRYSLGTKNKSLQKNADGSLTLYAGSRSPGADKESNWLPAPKGRFSLYIRAYWPEPAIVDGTWQPPVVQKL